MEYCIEFTLCDLLYFVLLADQSVEEKEINLIYDKIFQNGRVHVDIPEAKDISPVRYMTYSPSPT